jgi:hypothetical protein
MNQPAATLLDRLKGYSIDAQSTMRMEGRDKGRPFQELNTRFMRIYISSSGRIFDYSKVEAVGARTGQFVGGNSGMKVVRFGEEWLLGNVGQRWDISGTGLIKIKNISVKQLRHDRRNAIDVTRQKILLVPMVGSHDLRGGIS